MFIIWNRNEITPDMLKPEFGARRCLVKVAVEAVLRSGLKAAGWEGREPGKWFYRNQTCRLRWLPIMRGAKARNMKTGRWGDER